MRGIARLFGFIFATGAIVFVVAVGILAAVVWKYEQDLPDYSQLKNYEPPVMTRVHAADGSLLAEYSRERRLYLPSLVHPGAGQESVHFRRGQELLQSPRRRPGGDSSRGHRLPPGIASRSGRVDHHPAGGEELPPELRPNLRPQDPGDPAQPAHRGRLFEGEDPGAVPQRDLSRPLQLRRRRRRAELFRQIGSRADDRRSRLSGGPAEGAERSQSIPQPRSRHRAPQLRDRPYGRGRLHHRRAGSTGEGGAARRQSPRADAELDRRRLLRRGSAARVVGALRRAKALRGRPLCPDDARSENSVEGPEGARRRTRAL